MNGFSFKPDTTRYEPQNALWLGRAAKLAYNKDENKISEKTSSWGFDKCRFFSRRESQAFTIANDKMIITAFRGTEPTNLKDWMTDADLNLVDGPCGEVHEGFNRALTYIYQDIRNTISEFQDNGQSLWFTGHSLGAALATLAVARLRHEEDKPVFGLYTFGQPRTGDRTFERIFNLDFKARAFRFVNNNDVVPRVPPRELGYSHVGTFLYFDAAGEIHSDMSWWYKLLDSVKGRIEDFLKPGTDGMKDHAMDRYLIGLEKNAGTYPRL
jgi:triacylglycerol lipase